MEDCPRERYIPIFLIVGGVFGVVKALINIATMVYQQYVDDVDDEEERAKLTPWDAVINVFLFAWFIAGWYLIISEEVKDKGRSLKPKIKKIPLLFMSYTVRCQNQNFYVDVYRTFDSIKTENMILSNVTLVFEIIVRYFIKNN